MSAYDDIDMGELKRNSVQKARAMGAEAGYHLIGTRANPYLRKYQDEEYRNWDYMYRKTAAYRKAEKRSRKNTDG